MLSVLVTCLTVEVWEVFPFASIFLRATKTLRRLKQLTDWLLTMLRANRARRTLRSCGTSYRAGSKFARTHSALFANISNVVASFRSPHYRPKLVMKTETLKSEYINEILLEQHLVDSIKLMIKYLFGHNLEFCQN